MPLPVTAVSCCTDYDGATAGIPLAVDFDTQGIDASEIFLATLEVGGEEFVNVDLSDYTVTDLGGEVFTVTPDLTYASGITVRVFRWIPYTQPFQFSYTGPLAPGQIMAMGNRIVQEIQQLRAEAGLDGAAISLPPGSTFFRPIAVFDDATDRGNTAPGYIGQIGVQIDPEPMTIWIANGLTAGAWVLFKLEQVFADAAARLAATPAYAGQLGYQVDTGIIYAANSTTTGDWINVSGVTPFYRVPLADPTGVTDSRAAIQTVLDAVDALGGGIVLLDTGTYRINALFVAEIIGVCSAGYLGLEVPANVRLCGGGRKATTLKMYHTAATTTGALYGAVISNKGARTAATAYGAGSDYYISDMSLETDQQADDVGINIGIIHADGFTCERVNLGSSKYHGLECNQSRRVKFIDCTTDGQYSGNSGSPIQFDYGASGPKSLLTIDNPVYDCEFVRCTIARDDTDTYARDVDMAHGGASTLFSVTNIKFVDCIFVGRSISSATAIITADNDGNTPLTNISDIQFIRCHFITRSPACTAINYGSLVSTRTANDWHIEDCVFTGPAKTFILFGNGSSTSTAGIANKQGLTIKNNVFETDMGGWTTNGDASAITVFGCGNVNITGNQIRMTGIDAFTSINRMLRVWNSGGLVADNTVQHAGVTAGTVTGINVSMEGVELSLDTGAVNALGLTVRDNRVGAAGLGCVTVTGGGAASFGSPQPFIVGSTFIAAGVTYDVDTVVDSRNFIVTPATAVTSAEFTVDALDTNYYMTGANDADGGGTGSLRVGKSVILSGNSCFGSAPTSRHYNLTGVVTDGTNDVQFIDFGISGQTLTSVTDSGVGTVDVVDSGATGTATFSVAPGLVAGDTFIASAVTYTVVSGGPTVFVVTPDTASPAGDSFNIPATVMVFSSAVFSRYLKIWQGSKVTGIAYHRTVIGALPRINIDFCASLAYANQAGSWDTTREALHCAPYWDGAANVAAGVFYAYNPNTGAIELYTGNGGVNFAVSNAGVPAIRTYGQIQMSVGI